MKVLYVATVRSHIGQFHMPVIRELASRGHEVHAAFKDNSTDKPGLDLSGIQETFNIPFARNPFKLDNIAAFFALKKVIDSGDYDIIHCHTPMGAMLTRLAAIGARRKGTTVFYTAHGFHFYKGAPKKNWVLYYPVEKTLAKLTDVLITINREDYDLTQNRHFRSQRVELVGGVGVDLSRFSPVTTAQQLDARKGLGLDEKRFVMLYAADLSKRKNQSMIFKALSLIKDQIPNAVLLLPGQPILLEEYKNQCEELGITGMIQFLGYRRDIDRLLAACDCVVSSSRQEGLPINLIEAAARGKYIIATNVRGNSDVVQQSGYGTLVPLDDYRSMAEKILDVYTHRHPTNTDTERLKIYDQKEIVRVIMEFYSEYSGKAIRI